MAIRRWVRIDVGWSNTEWLALLPVASRLAWIELLCYVKTAGSGGRAKAMTPAVAELRWNIPADGVQAMLDAAVDGVDPALHVEDREWVITKWEEYQNPDPTAAERMRRHRMRISEQVVTTVTRNERRNLSRDSDSDRERKKKTSSKKKEDRNAVTRSRTVTLPESWTPNSSHAELATAEDVKLEREANRFRNHAAANGRVQKDWDAAFRNWLLKAGELNKASGSKPHPDSQAAKIRNELPRRNGPDPSVKDDRRRNEDRKIVEAWKEAHPAEAATIWQEVTDEVAQDQVTPQRLRTGMIEALFRSRVLHEIREPGGQ